MHDGSPATRLRRGVLAVSVLHDLDLLPTDRGVILSGAVSVEIGWSECLLALGGLDPESAPGHDRLTRWLLARRWIADRVDLELAGLARPVGLPTGHVLHPGQSWVRERVLGGVLHLGLGLVGLDPADTDRVVVVPPGAYEAAGVDTAAWWPAAARYLTEMGQIAAERWLRAPHLPLRPMGDCDVTTLLGARGFRSTLAGENGGMCPVAVPMRTRGWTDLRRIDPAYCVAAAAATEPEERGFPRPVLVTADEVAMVATGGRPGDIVLRDPAPAGTVLRPVRYR